MSNVGIRGKIRVPIFVCVKAMNILIFFALSCATKGIPGEKDSLFYQQLYHHTKVTVRSAVKETHTHMAGW